MVRQEYRNAARPVAHFIEEKIRAGTVMGNFLQRLRYYSLILLDPQTPWFVKLILAAGLLYILFPVDFLADSIPLFGWLDDLAVASFVVAIALRLVPKGVIEKVRREVFGRK